MSFTLGLDLDGVVADYTAGFGAFVAEDAGIQIGELPPPTSWNFHQSGWPILDTEHYLRLHTKAVENALFAEMPIIDGAAQAVRNLRDAGVSVRIVTHRLLTGGRFSQVVTDTVDWLDHHGIEYDDLCFLKEKADLDCDLMLDDSPTNLQSFKGAGVPYLIYDQPYNRLSVGDRVRNWSGAEFFILSRAGLL